jgi:GAF domain-containing protein
VTTSRKSRPKTKRRKAAKAPRRKAITATPTTSDKKKIALLTRKLKDALEQHKAASKRETATSRELNESLERETATSQVLGIISGSPIDLEPVFETILANATRLCEASYGALWLFEGDAIRAVAFHGAVSAPFVEGWLGAVYRPDPLGLIARVARTRQAVQVPDLRAERVYLHRDPLAVSAVETAGIRTLVNVPLLKQDDIFGVIAIYRQEVRPFTDKQIALVTSFASQAVIAIENARLLNELRDRTNELSQSLDQQTATSKVLGVISSSLGELEPVFQAMLANATRLCEAHFGILYRYDGNVFHAVALQDVAPAFADHLRREPPRPGSGNALGRLLETKRPVHIADVKAEPAFLAVGTAAFELGGARTYLIVPMLKNEELIGAISIYRQDVRPFTDKQIAFVTSFAAQAVIAIENTRLLNELRESLEQQTATSEVLGVISSSPGELEPVFQAMLENSTRICEAKFGTLYLHEGGAFRIAAMHNAPPAYAENRRREPMFRRC